MSQMRAKACGLCRILTQSTSAGAMSLVNRGLPDRSAAASRFTVREPTWVRFSRSLSRVTIMLMGYSPSPETMVPAHAPSGAGAGSKRLAM